MKTHGQNINQSLHQPNILFIMVDDLWPELGCYSQSHIKSLNFDRLAGMGQLFTQAYVNYPVCGPRAILLSGLNGSLNQLTGGTVLRTGMCSTPKRSENKEEWYDLEEDPYELNNVNQDPDYQTVLKEMKLKLKNY